MKKIIDYTTLASNYVLNFLYDAYRYVRYSTKFHANSKISLQHRIIANCHVIEKGLSLPKPKEKYGLQTLRRIYHLMQQYKAEHNDNDYTYQYGLSVIKSYIDFHTNINIKISEIEEYLNTLRSNINLYNTVIQTTNSNSQDSYRQILSTRHTTRQFSKRIIDDKLLIKAVDISRNTPSVCNRQAWKVYSINSKKVISKILSIQNGNRGFGDQIPVLLIVTTHTAAFQGPNERYQQFIDGGLFSMNLINSLHYYNLGTCPLNWSMSWIDDLKIRKHISISDEESIIMFIGVGYKHKMSTYAKSNKKPIHEILSIIK